LIVRGARPVVSLALLTASALALILVAPAAAAPAQLSLTQLKGERGCLVDRSARAGSCGTARALKGAGPFMGSNAVAVSPDGRNVYVAASRSDAIAVFARDAKTGALRQRGGSAGCVAADGAFGCGRAIGLDGPNSLALSPNGRFLYATSRASASVTVFRRKSGNGALVQLRDGAGCVSGLPIPGCAPGRGLSGPDVVALSPDGESLYVGSFFGNAVAVFKRERNGALAQFEGEGGCLAEAIAGCAPAIGIGAPEGLAVSPDGRSVYVAGATSNSIAAFSRDLETGALSQPGEGAGCVVDASTPIAGCTAGVQLLGANALAFAPAGRDLYATSLFSDSVTSFGRLATGAISQKPGTRGCLIYLRSAGCSFGRELEAPEGIAVAPDGRSAYVASFASGAIDVLARERESGVVVQVPGRAGCIAAKSVPECRPGRALKGVSSVAVSPDGRNVYATSFFSNAVDVFRRSR
jgi:DNA-binding beta-propeller fold protein YncE